MSNASLPPFINTRDDGVTLTLRVQPRASSDAIVGRHGDALRVRVTAPPVDSAANEAVASLVARVLGRPASAVAVIHGHASRSKVVLVRGIVATEALRLLAQHADAL